MRHRVSKILLQKVKMEILLKREKELALERVVMLLRPRKVQTRVILVHKIKVENKILRQVMAPIFNHLEISPKLVKREDCFSPHLMVHSHRLYSSQSTSRK